MAGRPPLLTPEVVRRAGQLREGGAGIAEIGQALGLSRRFTFRALAEARPSPTGPLSKGHVRAIELLLRRPWEADRLPAPARPSLIDELAARRPGRRPEAP
jgi:hypothetical protein